jgi:hypothetical protein
MISRNIRIIELKRGELRCFRNGADVSKLNSSKVIDPVVESAVDIMTDHNF